MRRKSRMSLRTDLWQRGRDHLELGVTWSCPLRQSQQMPTLFASSEKNVQWIKVVTNDSIATCSSALYIFPFWNFRHRLVRLYWYSQNMSRRISPFHSGLFPYPILWNAIIFGASFHAGRTQWWTVPLDQGGRKQLLDLSHFNRGWWVNSLLLGGFL